MADKTLNVRIQLRHDLEANWLAVGDTLVPLAGEACVTMDGENKGRFKIGDGASTWNQLEYVGGDSEILAKAVMFDTDMVFTERFGRYTPTGGKVTIPSNGKSLYEVLMDAYSQDKNPTVTQPTVGITSVTAKAYEVGTSVTPAYSGTFNAGKYEYDASTGVTATAWKATNNVDAQEVATQNGTFTAYVVPDGANYKITVEGTYSDGTIPKTALGQNYPDGQIKGGTKSATSGAITGYRNSFYGTTTDKTKVTDSAVVRGLAQKSGKALANGNTFTVTIPVGAQRVIIAYPATLRDVTSVKDVNGLNAEIKGAFTKSTLTVAGAGSDAGIEYKVYKTDFAEAVTKANSYTVTI